MYQNLSVVLLIIWICKKYDMFFQDVEGKKCDEAEKIEILK